MHKSIRTIGIPAKIVCKGKEFEITIPKPMRASEAYLMWAVLNKLINSDEIDIKKVDQINVEYLDGSKSIQMTFGT